MRQYVRLRKQALGLRVGPEPCVPQQYAWGEEAQVDWYEADAAVDGQRQTLQVFAMRSMAIGALSIGRIHAPRSRRFWKPTSWHSSTWAGSIGASATTTSAQR